MTKKTKVLVMVSLLIIVDFVVLGGLAYKGFKSRQMSFEQTYTDGQLAACGEKPNCASSFSDSSDSHYIAPHRSTQKGFDALRSEISKSCKEIISNQAYMNFECQSAIFGFVDDIEVYYEEERNLIHFRSASRVGHSDLGANHKRVSGYKDFLETL